MIFSLFSKASKTGSAAHTTSYSIAKRVSGKKYRLKTLAGPQNRDCAFSVVIILSRFTRQNISLLYATNKYRQSTTNLNINLE
jgi:hypothetical protein